MNLTSCKFILSAALLTGSVSQGLAQSRLYPQQFPLEDVEITSGPFLHAMMLNDSVLLAYDKGRLMQPFEKQAGLKESGQAYTNWSGGIGSGLDGHVGGHYLSALAISYAACHDQTMKARLKERLDWFIGRLKDCQDAWDSNANSTMHGYVGGVPESYNVWTGFASGNFDKFRRSWVPFYNVHKIMAGLRDAWNYTGSETCRTMFLKECDWAVNLISNISDTDLQSLLDIEHGGMNEVLADAYAMTGEEKYLTAAKRYSHNWLLNGMAAHNSTTLDNHHANTQVPKAIGFERIAELAGAKQNYTQFAGAAKYFWQDVAENRTIAIGGNSINEWFPAKDKYGDFTTSIEGVETCNSYNMLKLSEMLFNDTHDSRYTDFFENTMLNHILSAQDPVTGGYVYFTPERPQHYRVYSQVDQAMWCCVGSGMEDHGKYGEFVYSHSEGDDTLYVNLFMPTRLEWKSKDITLTQSTNFPYESSTRLKIEGSGSFKLAVRHPSWTGGFSLKVNGQTVTVAENGGYAYIDRQWSDGDEVEVSLPMHITVVPLQNYTDYVAFKYGPVLLGAKTSDDNLVGLYADDSRMGHIASGEQKNLYSAPMLIGDRNGLADSVKTINADSLTFHIDGYYNSQKWDNLVLEPFNRIHGSRYMMYWMNITDEKWQSIRAEVEAQEAKEQLKAARTIDQVVTGTQQSENDHFMQQEGSESGNYSGEYFRHAKAGAWFSYQLNTKGQTDSVSLLVRYWAGDLRKFNIYIDGQLLATPDLSGNGTGFTDVEYYIKPEMLQGKQTITVKFAAEYSTYAGGIYDVRLMSGYDPNARKYEPYTFQARDYTIGDEARTSAVSYDDENNTLTLTQRQQGNNNISIQMSANASDIYSILPSQYLFTIKGYQVSTATGASYLWWMNGANHSSQVAPTYCYTDSDNGIITIWDLRSSGLTDYMNFNGTDEILVSNNGKSFVNCLGLTSTSANMTSTISDIGYYSPSEIIAKYPSLGNTPLAINRINADESNEDLPTYNAAGQRIKPTGHGLYIQKGHKYIK